MSALSAEGAPVARVAGRLRPALLVGAALAVAAFFVGFGRLSFTCTDFTPVWGALRAWVSGADVYDPVAVAPFVTEVCPRGTAHLGYPPWFVLVFSWLGLFPVGAASRLWTLANVAMAVATVHLVTGGWAPRARVFAYAASLLFFPFLSLLFVGQFTLPVALGAALLVTGERRAAPLVGAIGLAAMALKPHVGAPILVPALGWLVSRGRPVLVRGLLVGGALAVASFAVSPTWIVDYPKAALTLMADPRNVSCDTCASLPSVFGGALPAPARLAISLALLAGAAWAVRARDPATKLGVGVVGALLALPHVRSYDYAVMIVPLAVAWSSAGRAARALLGVAWALPIATLFVERRTGVYPLLVSAALVLGVLLFHGRRRHSSEVPT